VLEAVRRHLMQLRARSGAVGLHALVEICESPKTPASARVRAWRDRPMSRRQRDDMVILAHIREQRRLSLGSYGRPRMTEELQELGLEVGHRRVGRLMAVNAIKAVRTRKYKATTGLTLSIRNGPATSATFGPGRVGCTWLSFSTFTPGASSAAGQPTRPL
jgi:hypothetical protein